MSPQHPLEQRAALLGAAVKQRVHALSNGITPKGTRPPFTRRYSTAEALRWWMEHRYDQLGLNLITRMTPIQVARLDAWLAQAGNHPSMQAGQAPQQQDAEREVQYNASHVLTRAMGQEQRIQGPPVGGEVL